MARQDAEVLQQMFNTPGLKPRLMGISHMDNHGNQVYDTGDVINPGNSAVMTIGSQLSQALSDLPENRTFQRMAERGKFEGTPLGQMTMLGSEAPGKNRTLGQSPMGGPDVGMAMTRLRRKMDKEKDSAMQNGDYDERGRRKTFGMLGTGAFGMPAPEGPLSADRMPYQDVLQSAGVTPDALMRLPGVLAASGSTPTEEDKAKAEEASKKEEQAAQQQQVMTMLSALSSLAGDRSFSFEPGGEISMGAAPKQAASKQQPQQTGGILEQLFNPSRKELQQQERRVAADNLGNAVGAPMQQMLSAASQLGMPAPTIGGPQPQPQPAQPSMPGQGMGNGSLMQPGGGSGPQQVVESDATGSVVQTADGRYIYTPNNGQPPQDVTQYYAGGGQ